MQELFGFPVEPLLQAERILLRGGSCLYLCYDGCKWSWVDSTSFVGLINSILDTPTIDLAISGGGVLTANSRGQNTNMIMTANHVSGSTFSLAGGAGYTVSGGVATIGADNTAFLNTAEIQFYISGLLLKKGSDVTRLSSTSFIVNYPLSNGGDIQILGLA